MTTPVTFKRRQVVWACWRCFAHHNDADPRSGAQAPFEVPSSFATRCRKLMEVGVADLPASRPGREVAVDGFQAFELGVALRLSDLGLNQQLVAFFLDHIRPALRGAFERIEASPDPLDGVISATDRPLGPSDPRDPALADTSTFLVVRPVEVKEAFGPLQFDASRWKGSAETHPLIFFDRDTDILFGADALMRRMLPRRPGDRVGRASQEQGWIVIELAELASQLGRHLAAAPAFARGPAPLPKIAR